VGLFSPLHFIQFLAAGSEVAHLDHEKARPRGETRAKA
jgi:hypothetical protein